ncbi:glycerophosphodiester phosphodiesterase family protein [Virgibacillus sp. NKC19-3]|uniref:glycerophosphodiester phosphodiesterase n=1 Tax=Virgibacillus saliphilus TaxID=2831674 RepID=UPI001C9AD09E|nr:glycerophosphodiester phosphodiesterase family protein [Virgibacillus sp. NKC19-3]MBY7142932.1 glycerophosphodiester phosphodiesterase family protein [Virgibacillus sp. NKC19-3]
MIKFKFLVLSILSIFVLSFAFDHVGYAESADKTDDWLRSDKTEISAHRGAHVAVPENTAEAMKWAGLLGYGFVEIDIQETKDGQYVLMHDENIDRTTTGSGKIEDITLEEMKSYNVLDADGNETNYKVPTLQEALEEADKYNVGVNFDGSKGEWENKEFVDGIMEIAEQNDVLDHSFFVLSDREIRDQFHAWYPEATVTFLGNALEDLDEDIKELKKYDRAIYTTSINNIDKAAAEKIDEEGLRLHVYQVNTAETYAKAKKIEPRLIETDVIVPDGAGRLADLVEQLRKEEGIKNDQAAHALLMHLKAIEHFEASEQRDKVVKHLENFKKLLEHQERKNLITEKNYNTLSINATKWIDKYGTGR